MNDFVEIVLPLGVCVALPVLIVWLVGRVQQNETNRKADIMLKAIESGATVDTDLFRSQGGRRSRSGFWGGWSPPV